MNKNLFNAISDNEKVDALMYAIESTYLDIEIVPEEFEKVNRAINAFYALWDAIHKVAEDLEKLAEDARVVDVIAAAEKVRSSNCCLTTK